MGPDAPEPPSGIEPVPQTGGVTMRNHPTVLVGQTVTYAIVLFVILLITSSVGTRSLLVLCVLMALLFLYNLFVWRRTTYTFTDSELHVCRNLMVTKSDNYIHYTRLASVTVRRDIYNVIFGTSTLMFNINSSVNALMPEATLVLRRADADRMREELNRRVFSKDITVEQESGIGTMIDVSNADVVLNAILGQSSAQQIFGIVMLVYAVVSLFSESSSGFVVALVLLLVTYVIPLVASIIRYYNYRVYRVEDTVTVESGLITHTRRSFKVNKVNSVRLRSPLLARLIGRTVLEAEVVGINDQESMPLLCPLKRRAEVEDLLARLIPELHFEPGPDNQPTRQPRSAVPVMAITCAVSAVIVVAFFVALVEVFMPMLEDEISPFMQATVLTFLIVLPALLVLLLVGRAFLAQRHRAVCPGPDSVLVVHGTYDLSVEYVNYDKVQYADVVEGPLDRVFGVSHCALHMMSSAGFRELDTGLFPPEELERIVSEVHARIVDGRYDYRRYVRSIYQESGDLPKTFYYLTFRAPMGERFYMGFDAGTQSVKVAVYDGDLGCVAESDGMTTIRHPGPRMVEMDADEYLSIAIRGMADCVRQMIAKGLNPSGIRAIMGDGIICGIVGIDEDARTVTPYINYLDSRTQADADAINSMGLPIWGEETGNADASCMFPALFARWFQSNVPGFGDTGSKYVHNAPYILMHLAGLRARDAFIDQGAMSGWGLGYDVVRKRWSEEQLSILGIDGSMMPRIRRPWDVVGHLTREVSEATGVPAGIPVCAGAGDTMQSMLGCGMFRPGMAADVAGTCAMFCVSTDGIVPELSTHGKGLIFNSGSLDDSYFYWGYIRTGGLSLRWFRDSVCAGTVDYDTLTREASSVPAGCGGVTFLPYLTGGMGDEADASGAFLNMSLDTDRGTMWRAVLEAIGYDYIGVTDEYRAAGVALDRMTIAEGGSANDLWNRIKADMIGAEAVVMRTRGGAVMTDCAMAAHAAGDLPDLKGVLERAAVPDRRFEPDPEATARYRRLYGCRRRVMSQMSPVFGTLSRIPVA